MQKNPQSQARIERDFGRTGGLIIAQSALVQQKKMVQRTIAS
jgi:hypothetical protein